MLRPKRSRQVPLGTRSCPGIPGSTSWQARSYRTWLGPGSSTGCCHHGFSAACPGIGVAVLAVQDAQYTTIAFARTSTNTNTSTSASSSTRTSSGTGARSNISSCCTRDNTLILRSDFLSLGCLGEPQIPKSAKDPADNPPIGIKHVQHIVHLSVWIPVCSTQYRTPGTQHRVPGT